MSTEEKEKTERTSHLLPPLCLERLRPILFDVALVVLVVVEIGAAHSQSSQRQCAFKMRRVVECCVLAALRLFRLREHAGPKRDEVGHAPEDDGVGGDDEVCECEGHKLALCALRQIVELRQRPFSIRVPA